MSRTAKHAMGSLVYDSRRGSWQFYWYENGLRRSRVIGTRAQYRTKAAAWQAVELGRRETPSPQTSALTVSNIVQQYRAEKMPQRASTRRGYEAWIRNHIIPKWGDSSLSDLQARPVELWLQSLQQLAPKSKQHIRGGISILWDYAMWAGILPTQRNPMELVAVKNASKRVRKPRSLDDQQFQALLLAIGTDDALRTLVLIATCFGLRISEALGLRWADVDWLGKTLRIERSVVKQIVDTVKTELSARTMICADEVLKVLGDWKQATQFSSAEDWMFASPTKIGRQPLSYTYVWKALDAAAKAAGIAHISSHTFRHTYRTWLDAEGTSVGVQQKCMRHADIRTTMQYGDALSEDMRQALQKVASRAIPRAYST